MLHGRYQWIEVFLVHKFGFNLDRLVRLGLRFLLSDLLNLHDLVIFLLLDSLGLLDDSTCLLKCHGKSLLNLDQWDEDLIDKAHISGFSEGI